ncbi:AHNK protein, partial [Nothoprocta ornata]|nr:AHNK protein [Nothoprocta ornata]
VPAGDQIVGATVYFENVPCGEVAQLLHSMGHHTVGLRLQRRGDRSPARAGTPDVPAPASPELVLSGDDEEYRRIYTKKIKPRLKSEDATDVEAGGMQSRTITVTRKVTAYTVDVSGHEGAKGPDGGSADWKTGSSQQEFIHVEPGKTGMRITPATDAPGISCAIPTKLDVHMGKAEVGRAAAAVPGAHGAGGHVRTPEIHVPVPGAGFHGAGPHANGQMGSPDGDFHVRGPKLPVPGTGIQWEPAGKWPQADIAGADLGADIQAPAVDVSLPDSEVGKIKFPAMKMPKFGFPAAGATMEAQVVRGGVDIAGPKVPTLSPAVPEPSVHIMGATMSSPSVEGVEAAQPQGGLGKVKIPHMTIPKFTTLDAQGQGPAVEGLPKGDTGHVGIPDVAIKGEWKGPKFGKTETPKISMADVNLNLKGAHVKGDASAAVPRMEADIKGLGFDAKGPKIDVKAPHVEFEGPEGSLKGPGLSMPSKTSMPDLAVTVKGPQLKGEGDVSSPQIGGSLKGPQVGIKGPKVGVDVPDVDIKGPKVPVPEMHVQTPQISMPDIDLNLKGPKVKGDLDVSAPKGPALDIKGPKVELEAPDVDIHGPEGKLKMPKLKMPKFGVPGLKGEGPDLDVTLPKGEVDISGPKVDIEVPSPSVHIKGPKVDIEAPDVELECPEAKLKTPKVKLPHFNVSGPKFEGADIDVNLPKGDMEISGPEVELDVEGPEGKWKGPKFR